MSKTDKSEKDQVNVQPYMQKFHLIYQFADGKHELWRDIHSKQSFKVPIETKTVRHWDKMTEVKD
jgi:hypothetical protein